MIHLPPLPSLHQYNCTEVGVPGGGGEYIVQVRSATREGRDGREFYLVEEYISCARTHTDRVWLD